MAPHDLTYDDKKTDIAHVDNIDVEGGHGLEKYESHDAIPVADITPEMDKSLRRRADLMILPLMMLMYGLQYLDKMSMSYAVIMGFRTDRNINLSQYSWLSSIFHLGYLAGAHPMSIGQQKLPLSKFTAFNICTWGVVVCLLAVGPGFASLMGIRFLLGFFESSITAALIIFTSQWYKSSEQGSRTGYWSAMTGVGAALGGLMSWALSLGDIRGTLSIPGYRVLFITLGCFTSLIGFIWMAIIPDKPEQAWWLTKAQKAALPARLAGNHNTVSQDVGIKRYQIIEALTDPLVYLYMFTTAICCIPTGGFTGFFAILIQGMGFTVQESLLLGIGNASLGLWIAGILWIGDKVRKRCAMTYFPLIVSTAGVAMVWGLPKEMKVARVMGYFLALPFAVPQVIVLSLVVTNVAGRTKKTIVNGFYLCFLCAGNLCGPQVFRQKDAPDFVPALVATTVCNLAVMLLISIIWFIYHRENKRRDKIVADAKANGTWDENADLGQDLTDRENIRFRYTV